MLLYDLSISELQISRERREAAVDWKGHSKGEGGPCYHSECARSTLTKLVPARFSSVVLTRLALEAKLVPNQIGFLISGHKETQGNQ